METLPQELSNAIDRELASLHPDTLRNACFELTQRYLNGTQMKTDLHRQAYIAARLPATYGATLQVLRRIEPLLESTKSLLDLGSGVGSLAWGAQLVMPKLAKVTLVENDVQLLRMGQHLMGEKLDPIEISWCRDDLRQEDVFSTHDVVMLSYVINELTLKDQLHVLKHAYDATEKFLIIIEPGTPDGFGHILTARHFLQEQGAHIVAPCPHDLPCPLAPAYKEGKDWCHFSVRIPRGKYHRRAKEGTLPYEDEKYCYLVVSPTPIATPKSRILKAPIRKTGHVILDLCTQGGSEERKTISKKEGAKYLKARDSEWGDAWD